MVVSQMSGHHSVSMKEVNFVHPLRLGDGTENISPKFRAFIDKLYGQPYGPEEVLGYIYAILYAPSYRRAYAEFLRIDFPRIPFPQDASHFHALSVLGWALVRAHLLRSVPPRRLGRYPVKGNHVVEAIQYAPTEEAVYINPTQCFKPIPNEVWDFHIGGYQVLAKYLKSRKGRALSLDEITHIGAVTDALAFTIEQMQRIDEAYLKAFPGRG